MAPKKKNNYDITDESEAPEESDPLSDLDEYAGTSDEQKSASASQERSSDSYASGDEALDVIEENEDHNLEDDDDDDDEGVGAVKIRPGETDHELDSATSNQESEGDESEAYEEEEEEDEDEDDDDDDDDDIEEEENDEVFEAGDDEEDLENNNDGLCMYCRTGGYIGPRKGPNPAVICAECQRMVHYVCGNINSNSVASSWKCPDCTADETVIADDHLDEQGNTPSTIKRPLLSSRRRSSRQSQGTRQANGLAGARRNSSRRGAAASRVDGSRTLRKRKSSTLTGDESDADVTLTLRKRRRNGAATPPAPLLSTAAGSPSRLTADIGRRAQVVTGKRTRHKLIVRFTVKPELLDVVVRTAAATSSVARPDGARHVVPNGENGHLAGQPIIMEAGQPTFYCLLDKNVDELKGKPYGGILSSKDADTSKTLPSALDRRGFDEAKQSAEEDWRARAKHSQQVLSQTPNKKSRRHSGSASQIECIQFGDWEIETWYAAPYPEEYSRNRVLYICEFCLKYMNSEYVAWRHKLKCPAKHPPGDEIYRKGIIAFFEVDGRKNPVYCQNLCLLSKLFLGSKTLYYDVEPFLFYVLCEHDQYGYHFVGYFSKEKRASSQNNLSCIVTLPIHQRKGYGNLLMDFSYLLTRVEQKTGSPEKPLSDMGLVTYRNYWRLLLCRYFTSKIKSTQDDKQNISIKQISDETGMTLDDVVSTLEGMRFLIREPQTSRYALRIDMDFCRQTLTKWEAKKYVTLDEDCLIWTPFIMGRGNFGGF